MLEDVLLITEKHHQAAETILEKVLAEKKDKYIIAISGESGSGKSELSHVVARKLKNNGIRAKVLHSDDYYKVLPLKRTPWRKEHGISSIGLEEYDWEKINRTIEDFKAGKTSEMPCIDLVTDQVDTLITDFKDVEMLVLDGLYAMKSDGIDLRVFIELTYHETKKAQVARGKEPQNEFRMQVLQREHEVVQSLKPMAHLLVTKEYQVEPNGN